MSCIRLVIFLVAAAGFCCFQPSTANAQGGADAMNDAMERAMRGSAPPPGARGVPPQGDQSNRGAASPGGIGSEGGSSNRSNRSSSSSRSRRSRSSRSSDSSNAIKTNPLFQLFDTNGNGQLSLEEIDAASRILYMLDANEDDRITADEVEDLAGGGSDNNDDARRDDDRDDDDDRQASRDRSRSRSNRSGSTNRSNRDFSNRMSQNGMSDRGNNSDSNSKKKATNRRGGRDFSSRMSQNGMSDNGQSGDAGKKRGSSNSRDQGDSDFDTYDKNGDGVLKRTELSSRLRLKFRKMDANEDGEVDPDEFDEYMSDPALNGGVR